MEASHGTTTVTATLTTLLALTTVPTQLLDVQPPTLSTLLYITTAAHLLPLPTLTATRGTTTATTTLIQTAEPIIAAISLPTAAQAPTHYTSPLFQFRYLLW